jgi:hypothetical protein
MSHFGLMLWFSALVSAFFGVMLRATPRQAWKLGLRMFAIMTAVSLAAAWLMVWVT